MEGKGSRDESVAEKLYTGNFLVIKTLDPDWIRIGIQPKMMDPDLESMNPDPKHPDSYIRISLCTSTSLIFLKLV